jgi:hypothetical protein
MQEEVKQKIENLKLLLDSLTPIEISQILCGERPKRQEWITPLNQNGKMDYSDFKVIQKTINDNIKNHLKGRTFYPTNIAIKNKKGEIVKYEKNDKPYVKKEHGKSNKEKT